MTYHTRTIHSQQHVGWNATYLEPVPGSCALGRGTCWACGSLSECHHLTFWGVLNWSTQLAIVYYYTLILYRCDQYQRASPPAAGPPPIDDWLIVDRLLDLRFLCCIFVFLLCFLDPEVLFGLIFGASGLTWGPMGSLLKVLDWLWRLMG